MNSKKRTSFFTGMLSFIKGSEGNRLQQVKVQEIEKHFQEHLKLINQPKNIIAAQEFEIKKKEEDQQLLRKLLKVLEEENSTGDNNQFKDAKKKLLSQQEIQLKREEEQKRLELQRAAQLKQGEERRKLELQRVLQVKREEEKKKLELQRSAQLRSSAQLRTEEEQKKLALQRALQQKREADVARSKFIQEQFYEVSTKEGFKYCCCLPYLPIRYEADSYHQEGRRKVYNFKDGKNTISIAEEISKYLLMCYPHEQLREIVFAVIPASTVYKNENRFKSFCELVSNRTGLINGFQCISITKDREELKGSKNANKISNLNFRSHLFNGRKVILFDDVMTTGSSFIQNARKIKELGAKEVEGIFLARTINKG